MKRYPLLGRSPLTADAVLAAALVLGACSDGSVAPTGAGFGPGPWDAGFALPAEPQDPGDPIRDRSELLDGDFMTCGIPSKIWTNPITGPLVGGGFGRGVTDRIPGLAWSDEPLTSVRPVDVHCSSLTDYTLTSDPPPWWRAHKKNALSYSGMARGDHRGTMALATSTSEDDVERSEKVDAIFRDIHSYIETLRAPVYARPIDRSLAAQGKDVFLANCAGRHGTYPDDPLDDEHDTYPNHLISLDVVGTAPVIANLGAIHSPELVEGYNASFFGRTTRMVPNDPFPGYMPPLLDGIWATAPFLHNDSVPTLALLLDNTARTRAWQRIELGSTKFGHTFGDHLLSAERRAVLEDLKTL